MRSFKWIMLRMSALASSAGKKQGGIWLPVIVAAPFSSDREAVSKLAERCTACQLLPEHLIDVVIDFISQTAMPT